MVKDKNIELKTKQREDWVKKNIPKKFRRKFETLKEFGGVSIDQKSIDNMKKNLFKFMSLDSPDDLKLVEIKIIFLTKDGILCETNSLAEGFNEEEWSK